jgi:hypothetical protein
MLRTNRLTVFVAAALLLASNSVNTATVLADDFSCTEFIGYSQTMQWYFGGAQGELGRGRSQLRWVGGGAIDNWADPGYEGWRAGARVNGCSQNENAPDRVIFDVSDDFHADVGWWVGQINTVLGLIRGKYPSAKQIVLHPVVGGPGGALCKIGGQDVRAAFNHPYIWQAINQVAGGNVVVGFDSQVRSCADYADTTGHLTDDAKGPIGQTIGRFYASGQAPPAPPPQPVPEQPAPPQPAPAPPAPPQPQVGFGMFCPPDVGPDFAAGFAMLRTAIGDVMGAAMDCEHGDPLGSGDVLQDTTTGLAFYRASTNTPTFTDGWNHWGLTDGGLVYWTGGTVDPPQ